MCHVDLSATLSVLTYLILKEPYGVSAIIISFYSWQRSGKKKTVWGYTVGKEWSQGWSQAVCSGSCSQLSGDSQELETARSLQMTTLTFSLRLFPSLCNGDTHLTNLQNGWEHPLTFMHNHVLALYIQKEYGLLLAICDWMFLAWSQCIGIY